MGIGFQRLLRTLLASNPSFYSPTEQAYTRSSIDSHRYSYGIIWHLLVANIPASCQHPVDAVCALALDFSAWLVSFVTRQFKGGRYELSLDFNTDCRSSLMAFLRLTDHQRILRTVLRELRVIGQGSAVRVCGSDFGLLHGIFSVVCDYLYLVSAVSCIFPPAFSYAYASLSTLTCLRQRVYVRPSLSVFVYPSQFTSHVLLHL